MLTVLLVVQVIVAVAMVTVILIQRSSSDGLGGLGGGGGGNSLMSGRASANLLTKTTSFLAVVFMANSLAMATITAQTSGIADRVIQDISAEEKAKEAKDVAEEQPPAEQTVPRAE